jgi:hypothetical protein
VPTFADRGLTISIIIRTGKKKHVINNRNELVRKVVQIFGKGENNLKPDSGAN